MQSVGSHCHVLYRAWVAIEIDVAVTKVRAPPFNRAAACGACRGGGAFGEHCICMAFTSKIGA